MSNPTERAAASLDQYLTYIGLAPSSMQELAEEAILVDPHDVGPTANLGISYPGAVPQDVPGFNIKIFRAGAGLTSAIDKDKLVGQIYHMRELHWSTVSKRAQADRRLSQLKKSIDPNIVAEMRVGEIATDGRYAFDDFWLHWREQWRHFYDPHEQITDKGVYRRPRHDPLTQRCAQCLVGQDFVMPSLWFCRVKMESTPTLRIPTTAIGAREIWRLRDIPQGKKKRDALLHWVAEHWRTTPSNCDDEAKVRAHLRGQRQFQHGGLSVEVIESREDYAAVLQFAADRERDKLAGLVRRRKGKS